MKKKKPGKRFVAGDRTQGDLYACIKCGEVVDGRFWVCLPLCPGCQKTHYQLVEDLKLRHELGVELGVAT